jgi:diguanylate cyclase (GGDEF)-like protein
MLKYVPVSSKAEVRVALVVLTFAAVTLAVIFTIAALYLTTGSNSYEVRHVNDIWMRAIVFAVLISGTVGPLFIYGLLNTMRELHQARAQLEIIAQQDPLTGLLNRRGFDAAAAVLIQQASARCDQLSALICDIDHFKKINDTYGHECGDKAIQHVASLLRGISSGGRRAVIGRQGGEEFAVILAGQTPREVVSLAEELRSMIASTPFKWGEAHVYLTISLGTSMLPSDGASVHSLLSRADAALYEAKSRGRNRVVQAPVALAA